jgi:phage shock protein PspC (stress-responsive transcriptional regulator)
MKGVTWYVVPGLAHRYETANDLIGLFWVLGAAGGAIRERNRIAAWWKSRTTH